MQSALSPNVLHKLTASINLELAANIHIFKKCLKENLDGFEKLSCGFFQIPLYTVYTVYRPSQEAIMR
jgi:hypothetical protein